MPGTIVRECTRPYVFDEGAAIDYPVAAVVEHHRHAQAALDSVARDADVTRARIIFERVEPRPHVLPVQCRHICPLEFIEPRELVERQARHASLPRKPKAAR